MPCSVWIKGNERPSRRERALAVVVADVVDPSAQPPPQKTTTIVIVTRHKRCKDIAAGIAALNQIKQYRA
jgi:hypothetical protein